MDRRIKVCETCGTEFGPRTLTVGSLFAGYGGIELALASVLDLPGHAPIYVGLDGE